MKAFLAAMLITGTVIGAGFASGGELAEFFARYGFGALWAVVITGVLFYLAIVLLLKASKAAQERGTTLNRYVFGRGEGAVEVFVLLNCFISLSCMFAGSDALGRMLLPRLAAYPVVSGLTFVVTGITVCCGIKGVMKAGAVIVPLIVVFVCVISAAALIVLPQDVVEPAPIGGLVLAPVVYTGMNMLLTVGALHEVRLSDKDIKKAALLSAVVLCGLMLSSVAAIIHSGTQNAEMPTPEIAARLGASFKFGGGILILAAIVSTMLTAAYTLVDRLDAVLCCKPLSVLCILTTGWCLSRIGFSNIIHYIYPITGWAGVVYFGVLVVRQYVLAAFDDKLLNKRHNKIHARRKHA